MPTTKSPTKTSTPTKLSGHEERVIAVRAGCDPRTVRSFLAGRPVHSTSRARIEEALKSVQPT